MIFESYYSFELWFLKFKIVEFKQDFDIIIKYF